LLKRFDPVAHSAASYITAAEEALDRAANVTQRILAFFRRRPLSPRPVRLSEVVDGMNELIRHSVGERIRIETHLNAQWWSRCDINQMENVILNLTINTRGALPNGGRARARPLLHHQTPGERHGAWPFHDLRLCASIVWVSEDRKPSRRARDGHDPHAAY
jgi:nitrogen-specific signal transduction histidine kinase